MIIFASFHTLEVLELVALTLHIYFIWKRKANVCYSKFWVVSDLQMSSLLS